MSHCMIWVKRINFALEFGLWNVFCVAFFCDISRATEQS